MTIRLISFIFDINTNHMQIYAPLFFSMIPFIVQGKGLLKVGLCICPLAMLRCDVFWLKFLRCDTSLRCFTIDFRLRC